MRLALQALFCKSQNLSNEDVKRRARIENELRSNPRSSSFLKKLQNIVNTPLKKAPEVFADESFPDVNIVAEYLDCQLDSCDVSDEYERVCFETHDILAEAADCYDILNNRLSQPIVAPKNCRHRLYYVGWEEERPETQNTTNGADSRVQEERLYEAEYSERPENSQGFSVDVNIHRSNTIKAPRKSRKKNRDICESEVQKRIRNHHSFSKRLVGWCFKGALTLLIITGGINGYNRLRSVDDFVGASVGVNQIGSEDEVNDLLIAKEGFRGDSADFLASELEDYTIRSDFMGGGTSTVGYCQESNSLLEDNDDVLVPSSVKVASLPEMGEISKQENESIISTPRSRRGLSSGFERRDGLEIPDVNNDALLGVQRF